MKIFVSYSRRDASDFAEKISETLEDEHSVFTDVSNIQVGEDWSNTIEDNIASCDIFILIVTFAALKSKEVEKEILQAQNKNKKIIPCFYSGIKGNELKWGIGKLQGIEFANENQLARNIYGKIKHLVQLQSKLDTTIQGTAEPVKESKQDRIKNTEVPTEEEIKPEVPKAEVQPKIESPVVPHAKSPRVEQKYRLSSKRTVVLVVAIGAIIAAIFSVYASLYPPQPANQTTPEMNNSAPIALDQSLTTGMNKPVNIILKTRDKDSNDNLTATVVYPPVHGELGNIDQADGSVTYTPTSGFTGNDQFTFKVNDGKEDSNYGKVDIYTTPPQPTTNIEPQQYSFIRTWGSPGSGEGQFNVPNGISVDSAGNVYVADFYNNRIQKFTSDGKFITKWGSEGSGKGQFNGPTGVDVDSAGNVYVADWDNNRIQEFTSDGKFILQWGSYAWGTGKGQFANPRDVAVDSSGNVYVADWTSSLIQKFTSDGKFILQWGSPGTGSGEGEFDGPTGVAVDPSGNVYVADYDNNRIQKFTSDGKFISQWGSSGSGEGQLIGPVSTAVDPSSDLYVAERGNNRIQVFGQVSIEGNNVASSNKIMLNGTTGQTQAQ